MGNPESDKYIWNIDWLKCFNWQWKGILVNLFKQNLKEIRKGVGIIFVLQEGRKLWSHQIKGVEISIGVQNENRKMADSRRKPLSLSAILYHLSTSLQTFYPTKSGI